MAQSYGTGSNSTIGAQARTDFYNKKALIAVRDKQYFMPLADVTAMPKQHGKTIKQDVYTPLLDDSNTNDQGIDANEATTGGLNDDGNLYGSSKDTGTIVSKLPALTENGGRVNRVGFTREQITGTIEKQGFFTEYTQESLDFDSDGELLSHITQEALVGANELTEAALQADLVTTATADGTSYFIGGTTKKTVNDCVTYADLMALSIALDNNKTPKSTKVIAGSRMTDTKTINGGRIMYCGSEMIPALRAMTDLHGAPAFVGVEKYADAGNTVNGEIGSIDQFRIVVVPEMQTAEDGGATALGGTTAGDGTNGIDIYPMLVVGDGAFTTVGFQTDGKTVKFTVTHKKPGKETADRSDPYGETGFYSIKWYYGFMALRPERLGIIWTASEKFVA